MEYKNTVRNPLPGTIHTTIEILLKCDVQFIRELYCKHPQFKQFLSSRDVIDILVERSNIYSKITSFPEYYVQYMMKYHPKESCIPRKIIIQNATMNSDLYVFENYDNMLFPNDILECIKLDKQNILDTLCRHKHIELAIEAYYGNIILDVNHKPEFIVYLAVCGGYIDEVIDPAVTRKKVISAFAALNNKWVKVPSRKHGNMPL